MCVGDSTDEPNNTFNLPTITEYMEGKNIFITGATGFIGKALLEKLLRSCPNIGTLYILMRPKRGKRLAERLEQITDGHLYDRLKREQPELVLEKKIVPLDGDMMKLNLGLCKEDRQLVTENVHLIFHVAATVRFDESLKSAVILNVRGTREVSQLALDTKHLEAYVHVSTAFANCDRPEAQEILYSPKADWKKTIDIVENLDDSILATVTQKYIGDMPNTYCFTKNLAEHVVHDMCKGKIPSKIFRPSIVVGSLREDPLSGWIDNFNGPLGILVAYGKGIMRTVYAHSQYKPDYIPVDVLTKSLIVCAWDLALRHNTNVPEIIHCTSHSAEWLRPTIKTLATSGVKILNEIPFNDVVWTPSTHTTNSTFICYVRTILFMIIPSMILDGTLMLTGKKPRLMRIQKKMYVAQLALRHFLNNEWKYPNDNLLTLQKRISVADKEDWDYEFANYDLTTYLRQCTYGLRRYLLNESDETLPNARKHYTRMYIIHISLQVILWSMFLTFLWKTFLARYFITAYFYATYITTKHHLDVLVFIFEYILAQLLLHE